LDERVRLPNPLLSLVAEFTCNLNLTNGSSVLDFAKHLGTFDQSIIKRKVELVPYIYQNESKDPKMQPPSFFYYGPTQPG